MYLVLTCGAQKDTAKFKTKPQCNTSKDAASDMLYMPSDDQEYHYLRNVLDKNVSSVYFILCIISPPLAIMFGRITYDRAIHWKRCYSNLAYGRCGNTARICGDAAHIVGYSTDWGRERAELAPTRTTHMILGHPTLCLSLQKSLALLCACPQYVPVHPQTRTEVASIY
jgi:hypothetical protein